MVLGGLLSGVMPRDVLKGDAEPASGADEKAIVSIPESERTTVMLRNLPNKLTQGMLLDILASRCSSCEFDFVYLPIDFRNRCNLGYAFVNFITPEAARLVFKLLGGFDAWVFNSQKVVDVCWASPHQGLQAHVERYRNSPVMHDTVPEEYRPAVFGQGGVRLAFPQPSKRLPRPKPIRKVPGEEGNGKADA